MDSAERSLELQAELAAGFIPQAWAAARDQAAARTELAAAPGNIVICGCGDSHHAAVSLEAVLASASGRSVRAATSMEAGRYLLARHLDDPAGLLLIGISASGEVARTLEAIELARRAGARTLALTTQAGSSLARAAQHCLSVTIPQVPHGPGLLSYLASLLMGYALAQAWAGPSLGLEQAIAEIATGIGPWIVDEAARARMVAEAADPALPVVFLGSGPLLGSAMFAAAKVVEAAGMAARGQDAEEWAHLEYFCDPPGQLVWLLSSAGRSADREDELVRAAQAIGRQVQISRWENPPRGAWLREMLAPLTLWAGPATFAARMMQRLGEVPFRGFGGGRSRAEGGGPSQIRSSARWLDLDEIVRGRE